MTKFCEWNSSHRNSLNSHLLRVCVCPQAVVAATRMSNSLIPPKVNQFLGSIGWRWISFHYQTSWISHALEVCWAHHHGCRSSHQIWTLPVVPFDAIVADHTGRGRVIYAIQVGRAASLKPPTWRGGNVPESSREKDRINWIPAHEM